jgi:hypothetical protein
MSKEKPLSPSEPHRLDTSIKSGFHQASKIAYYETDIGL